MPEFQNRQRLDERFSERPNELELLGVLLNALDERLESISKNVRVLDQCFGQAEMLLRALPESTAKVRLSSNYVLVQKLIRQVSLEVGAAAEQRGLRLDCPDTAPQKA